jgi:hypothetical protein
MSCSTCSSGITSNKTSSPSCLEVEATCYLHQCLIFHQQKYRFLHLYVSQISGICTITFNEIPPQVTKLFLKGCFALYLGSCIMNSGFVPIVVCLFLIHRPKTRSFSWQFLIWQTNGLITLLVI